MKITIQQFGETYTVSKQDGAVSEGLPEEIQPGLTGVDALEMITPILLEKQATGLTNDEFLYLCT